MVNLNFALDAFLYKFLSSQGLGSLLFGRILFGIEVLYRKLDLLCGQLLMKDRNQEINSSPWNLQLMMYVRYMVWFQSLMHICFSCVFSSQCLKDILYWLGVYGVSKSIYNFASRKWRGVVYKRKILTIALYSLTYGVLILFGTFKFLW